MEERKLFTSESVSEGHPDKICDQISDGVLDFLLASDENSRCACECFITTQRLIIGGEFRNKKYNKETIKPEIIRIAKETIEEIGYHDAEIDFDPTSANIEVIMHEQSGDIAQGVDKLGAGDQGIMFGYACNETAGNMPLAIVIAHKLVREATNQRKQGLFKWARPDMKSQVTIDYSDEHKPRIDTVLMSIQHDIDYNEHEFHTYIIEHIMKPVVTSFGLNSDFNVLINPTGIFHIGGPHGDTGLTGRKIIVDTYGGYAKHGGGAFSGKDATKVDRSAAYAARHIATNLVGAKICDKVEIQLSYAIGVAEPISISVDTFNTNKVLENDILKCIKALFDLTPGGIIKRLSLNKPIFKQVAAYGHMGRQDLDLPWEKLDMVDQIREYLDL
ncbi:MAG: methionine adenosyltransferase [Bacilli bacterium]|jgi:S-adenosylmethionine synthetase|nr:methionine adenosyltransferase [Bacilli bacterium]